MAARNTSVSLGDHFTDFIDKQVASGRYSSASDVIRTGLRKLEEHEEKLEWLRAEMKVAEIELADGKYREITSERWKELNREASERVANGKEADANAPR